MVVLRVAAVNFPDYASKFDPTKGMFALNAIEVRVQMLL